MIQTSCQNCLFKIGSPQTGCCGGRLEKFKEQDKAISSDGFYVINRLCNLFIDKNEDISFEEKRKSVSVKYGIVINCNGFSEEEIQKTIDSIKNQSLLPTHIYCVFQDNSILLNIFKPNYDYFSSVCVNFNTKLYFQSADKYEVLLELAEKLHKKIGFISVVDAGTEIRENYFYGIDKIINDEMKFAHIFEGQDIETYSCSSILTYGNPKNIEGMEDYTCLI